LVGAIGLLNNGNNYIDTNKLNTKLIAAFAFPACSSICAPIYTPLLGTPANSMHDDFDVLPGGWVVAPCQAVAWVLDPPGA